MGGLEKLANASSMRVQYAQTSQHVHGGSEAAQANIPEAAGVAYKVTDGVIDGFISPLWYASDHLVNCTVALAIIGQPNPTSTRDLICVRVLGTTLKDFQERLRPAVRS
ncbi:hypothetical protein [Plantibacter sp. YIM 135249]|uniref:hypothetical protein n=1 Tax=Plantibacter sp. YIM 135249 TaxID=3423918 RepID=UPI003D34C0AE